MRLRTTLTLMLALGIRPACGVGADSPAAPLRQYQAKVVDPNGQPISGALVERYEDPDWRMGGGANPRLADRGIANDQGTVRFTLTHRTPFTLVASKPGLSIAWTVWYPQLSLDEDPVELTLTAPASVSGVVQDADGKPVADAEVWVMLAYRKGKHAVYGAWSPLNNLLGHRLLATRTTAEGRFRLERMPQDTTLDLAVAKAGLALELQAPSFFAGSPSLSFQAGQSDLLLTVKPTGAIEGQVVEEATGAPLAGARLQPIVMGSGNYLPASPLTGADGRFRCADLGAGEYQLCVTVGTSPLPDWVCETVPVTVESGVTHGNVKITASHGGIVEVTVRDQRGDPVKDAPVTAGNESGRQSAQTTDQGVARLRLAPGEYTIFAQIAGFSGEPIQATSEHGQTQRLAYALAPAPRFAGTVVDPQGQPAPKVLVALFPFQGERLTDAQGHFVMTSDANPSGGGQEIPRIVIARDPDHNLAAALDIEADSTNASVRLEPALTVVGRVTGVKGKAVPNAELSLTLHTERFGTQLGAPIGVDAQGRFEIKGLPPGRHYGVRVSAKGYGIASRTLDTQDVSTRRLEVEPFELPVADQRLAGVVLNENDQPVAGANLYTFGEGQPNLNGRTDAQGRFTFAQVCTGPVQLSASSQRGRSFGTAAVEGGDTNVTIRLSVPPDFASGSAAGAKSKLAGTVVDPEGKPARNLPVALFPDLQEEKRTDAEGRFTLTVDPNPFDGMRNTPQILIARDLARNLAASLDIDVDSPNASLRLEPGLILAGRVTDANGNGIAKAETHLIFHAGIMGRSMGQPVHTDIAGRFEIKGLPPGRNYSVTVVAKGYGTAGRDLGTMDPTVRKMDLGSFQLPKADQRIAGVVVDDEDKPVKGATISAYGNGQPNVNGQTDAKGRFAFDQVCAGPINIYANSQHGNDSGNGSTVAQGGDTNITVRFGVHWRPGQTASAGIIIAGTIVDPDGKPAPGARVSLLPDPQGEKTANAEGRFKLAFDPNRFGGMPINQRVVIARDLIRNLAAALDLEEGATNADLKLQPAWTLAGRIVDTNGAGISGGQAQLMFDSDHFTSLVGAPTRADAEGRFEIKGLPHGRAFSVRVSATGFGQDTPDIDPPAGDTHRVELDPTELWVADQRIAGVVLDADDKPVAGAWINGSGDKQPTFNGQTDSQGRFAFKPVCSGPLRLDASCQPNLSGNASVEGGDTNITLRIAAPGAGGGRTPPPPVVSLEGKPLPDLTVLGLAGADVPAKGPLLALLIDAEQRPSRRLLKRMTELADTLKPKGLVVIVLQAGALEGAEFAAWKQENAIPFPVGLFKGNREKARAAWGAAALPWLILTDADRKVTAEGFAIGELDEKLDPMKK